MTTFHSSHYWFDPNLEPLTRIHSGDMLTFKVLDCFSNTLLKEGTRLGVDTPKNSNPVCGPVYVEGATVGQTIAIEILDIRVGPLGILNLSPEHPALDTSSAMPELRRIPVTGGNWSFNPQIVLPVQPSIGTIGVTPLQPIGSGRVGQYGGNMDCAAIKKGTTLLLPVFVPGALIAMGDLHAAIGDGEFGDAGLEIEGEVDVKITLIDNFEITGPILIEDTGVSIIEFGDTLESSMTNAIHRLTTTVASLLQLEYNQCLTLMNVASDVRLCAISGPLKVTRAVTGVSAVREALVLALQLQI